MAKKNDKCPPQGRVGADRPKPQIQSRKTNTYSGKNDHFPRRSRGFDANGNPTRRRRRTIKKARRLLDSSSLHVDARRDAYQKVRSAKQPIKEAKRIVQHHEANRLDVAAEYQRPVELSDVQELRVKLIRRDYGIWSPHTDYLHRMEKDILTTGMSWEEYERRAVVVMKMEQPLSKEFRKAERDYARTGKWRRT
jgi:hypothetical protein